MTEKVNYYSLEYGNSDGSIRFGTLETQLNDIAGEVISDVKLQASYEGHYITLDKDGPREGWTVARCPGAFTITSGEFFDGPGSENAFIVVTKQGDIVLNAENGDVRIIGRNVEIIGGQAAGTNVVGNVNITANEQINLNAKVINLDAENAWKILSSGIGRITCKTTMEMYAGFTKCVTSASAVIPSKLGGKSTTQVVKETEAFT
jgi:hypothetical protein